MTSRPPPTPRNRRIRSLVAGLVCAALLAAGCASSGTNTKPAAPSAFADARPTANGAYFVRCTPRPDPIPSNQIFSLEVGVFRDAALKVPATGVRIHADADMPAHGHGMTLAPRVARQGDGRFRVEGMLMHMPGAWEIYIDIDEGAGTTRATFPVEVP